MDEFELQFHEYIDTLMERVNLYDQWGETAAVAALLRVTEDISRMLGLIDD